MIIYCLWPRISFLWYRYILYFLVAPGISQKLPCASAKMIWYMWTFEDWYGSPGLWHIVMDKYYEEDLWCKGTIHVWKASCQYFSSRWSLCTCTILLLLEPWRSTYILLWQPWYILYYAEYEFSNDIPWSSCNH